jgi:hypothetical protein
MVLYHRTNPQAAEAILQQGFRDDTKNYTTEDPYSGVWLSTEPLDENSGASGDIVLEVTTKMTESEIAQYEVVEEGKGYREFCIPAAVINRKMKIRIVEDRREHTPDWYRSDDPRNKQP